MILERLKAAYAWLAAHASSIGSWAAVLMTAASTLVAYGVVLPGHPGYRIIGGIVAVLTVLAARSSSPPAPPAPPGPPGPPLPA